MKVHELLTTPDKWTKGNNAKDSLGNAVGTADPCACSFCLMGAVWKCYGSLSNWSDEIFPKIREKLATNDISCWNDAPERTHAEVLALCRELDI